MCFTVWNPTKSVTSVTIFLPSFNLSELHQRLHVLFRCFTGRKAFATTWTESKIISIIVITNWIENSFPFRSNNCETFSDETTSSFRFYVKVNNLCERFIKWGVLILTTSYMASTLVAVAGGALFYYIKNGRVELENLYLPLKMKCVNVQLFVNKFA